VLERQVSSAQPFYDAGRAAWPLLCEGFFLMDEMICRFYEILAFVPAKARKFLTIL
jgi:hypothetical protein